MSTWNVTDIALAGTAIDCMLLANDSTQHMYQNGTYGAFSDALWQVVTVVHGKDKADWLRDRFELERIDGKQFADWCEIMLAEFDEEVEPLEAELFKALKSTRHFLAHDVARRDATRPIAQRRLAQVDRAIARARREGWS